MNRVAVDKWLGQKNWKEERSSLDDKGRYFPFAHQGLDLVVSMVTVVVVVEVVAMVTVLVVIIAMGTVVVVIVTMVTIVDLVVAMVCNHWLRLWSSSAAKCRPPPRMNYFLRLAPIL